MYCLWRKVGISFLSVSLMINRRSLLQRAGISILRKLLCWRSMRFIESWLVPRVGVVAILIGMLQPLSALDPERRIFHYGHAVWTVQNGGPRGGVFAVTQTTDGWLWIGTEFGLFRFDGIRFSPWQAPVGERPSSQFVTALASSRAGGLWVG